MVLLALKGNLVYKELKVHFSLTTETTEMSSPCIRALHIVFEEHEEDEEEDDDEEEEGFLMAAMSVAYIGAYPLHRRFEPTLANMVQVLKKASFFNRQRF